MKKKNIMLLAAILVIFQSAIIYLLINLVLAQLVIYSFYHTPRKNAPENWIEVVSEKPCELQIGNEPLMPGFLVQTTDYSIVVSGFETVKQDKESSSMYHIDENKLISFDESVRLCSLGSMIFKDSVRLKQIERAAGKRITNEYDLMNAVYTVQPDDFTLLDVQKNKGVKALLQTKCPIAQHEPNVFAFDNGNIKGFIVLPLGEPSLEWIYFSNCKKPDSWYRINACNFSIDELSAILGTITFISEP